MWFFLFFSLFFLTRGVMTPSVGLTAGGGSAMAAVTKEEVGGGEEDSE